MKVEAFLVHSFTANGTGGNPAGVVLHADHLSNEEKLAIAQAVGYSETAFVSQDDEVDFELSFFTITGEVDFCGHATLAAFSTMYQKGIVTEGQYVQRTKAGLLAVTIASNGRIVMEQRLPEYLGVFGYEAISECIGIDATVLESTQLPIEVISTGLPDMIVPVPHGYLDRIQVNEHLLSDFCKKHDLVSVHAFELCERDSGLTASCRNFAPLFGIPEESATGSASGALACYLTKHLRGEYSNGFTFEQGRAMGCVSSITASVESNERGILKVRVGGFAHEAGLQKILL
ncbi:PhzF family phenazine biosynthesis protein [Photobacterium galatheae]|uniref:Phenazine biosynthesis protein PhzF n=2 Tax=Photobacterium galatheae TaxID=1654360 RepID=A0A066RMM4_9GAMM|nr:PhzF family phenazine biosynthesis protein [Photobacterium galatheae]KDM91660.1 phenazine biosynthesis protein PhzF [Photobacterium galatheae]MCM0149734.1 PhzF family phenazine biosynthesis protein [Photobacterium galatheae]